MVQTLERDPEPAARRQALRVGVAAALAALLAAGAAGVLAWSLLDGDGDGAAPELVLRFDQDDRLVDPLVADPTGTRLPTDRFDVLHGDTGSFADYRGRPLVVNWFSSTCVPCLKEMPDFERVHGEVGDDVTFLGISVQDSEAATRDIVERTGVTYDIGRDPTGELFTTIGGLAMPSTWFVDADGRIVDSHSGEMSAAELRRRIAKLASPD